MAKTDGLTAGEGWWEKNSDLILSSDFPAWTLIFVV